MARTTGAANSRRSRSALAGWLPDGRVHWRHVALAADAVSRRTAKFTEAASPGTALDAAEEARETAWRLQADERLPFGPDGGLLAFPQPSRAAWFRGGT